MNFRDDKAISLLSSIQIYSAKDMEETMRQIKDVLADGKLVLILVIKFSCLIVIRREREGSVGQSINHSILFLVATIR